MSKQSGDVVVRAIIPTTVNVSGKSKRHGSAITSFMRALVESPHRGPSFTIPDIDSSCSSLEGVSGAVRLSTI